MKSRKRSVWYLVMAIASLSVSAQNLSPAQQGITAFNNGNYDQALSLFQQAENNGNTSQSVDYNIAVSLYRLGRLEEAEQRFLQLNDVRQWQVLVNYNLGLVYEAQGQQDTARRYFQLSVDQTEHEKIQQLANNKLSAMNRSEEIVASVDVNTNSAKSWAAIAQLTSGIDSNASSLADDLLEDSSRGEDSFSQLLLYGHVYAKGTRNDGLRLYGLGFAKRFNELEFLNSQVLGIGAYWEKPLLGWQSEIGFSLMGTQLNAEKVADQWQVQGSLWKRFRPGTIKLGLSYSDFSAGDAFPQIEGDRARAEFTWAKRFDALTTSLLYRHEWNNRQDLQRGGGFASYSPTRESVRARLDWRVSNKFSTRFEAESITSNYQDMNVLRDLDGEVKQALRDNHKLRLSTSLTYRISPKWRAELEYRYEDTEDEFELYTYDKNLLQASLQFQF